MKGGKCFFSLSYVWVHMKRMIPCAWAFTARRRTKDYLRVLTALKNEAEANGLKLKPTSIMLDFELAASRAFKEIFPEIKIRYCHFHFGQSLFRKVRIHTYSQNELFIFKYFS